MIKLYSKQSCPQCVQAKNLLDKVGVDYQIVWIDQDDNERDYLISKGHRTVPQLYVGDILFVEGGYAGLAALGREAILVRYNELTTL